MLLCPSTGIYSSVKLSIYHLSNPTGVEDTPLLTFKANETTNLYYVTRNFKTATEMARKI